MGIGWTELVVEGFRAFFWVRPGIVRMAAKAPPARTATASEAATTAPAFERARGAAAVAAVGDPDAWTHDVAFKVAWRPGVVRVVAGGGGGGGGDGGAALGSKEGGAGRGIAEATGRATAGPDIVAARASRSSIALANRRSGRFSRQRITMRSIASGTSGARARSEGGSSATTAAQISVTVEPSKGVRPPSMR